MSSFVKPLTTEEKAQIVEQFSIAEQNNYAKAKNDQERDIIIRKAQQRLDIKKKNARMLELKTEEAKTPKQLLEEMRKTRLAGYTQMNGEDGMPIKQKPSVPANFLKPKVPGGSQGGKLGGDFGS